MCLWRSNYSWDIIVKKKDGKIYLDKRSDGNFDQLTVSETAQEPIADDEEDINGVQQLSVLETTKVNVAFVEQSAHHEGFRQGRRAGALLRRRGQRLGGVQVPQVERG